MSLKILKAGMLDTIQDAGRTGYQHIGINPSGAMDRFSMAVANILVGNEPGTPVIEMHFPAASILFEQTSLIALSGADFEPLINGKLISLNQPVIVKKGQELNFKSNKKNSRCYLSVAGGMKLQTWLNSCSTNLKAAAGGLHGKKLAKNDLLECSSLFDLDKIIGDENYYALPWKANIDTGINNSNKILVIPGSEWNWLSTVSKEKFFKTPFFISLQSDRMGYRLASEPLMTANDSELISSGVSFGTIQLLPDGQLIILMADHQTTGGYPRLGNVISVHLPVLSQKTPGEEIYFEFTDQQNAESLILNQHQHLFQLQIACKLRLENFIHENN